MLGDSQWEKAAGHRAAGVHLQSQHLEAEAGRSLRPAWFTEGVPGQPGLHRETLSQKRTTMNKKTNNE